MKKSGMGSHESSRMLNDEWLTPPEIIYELGPFDLDPCSPINRPWETAIDHYSKIDNGLSKRWGGFVWLNPPYGKMAYRWLEKLSQHNNGIALLFARTETKMFQKLVWGQATSILFIYGRLKFYDVNGIESKVNSGAPSVLIAYGKEADYRLGTCHIEGKYIKL